MGGASRSHAWLRPPPHPTLPRDRKAEPRLPEPPPPLLAVAVWGWRQLSFFAGDGRGCRYGDRSVALGAASLREPTGPGPGHLLQLPGTPCGPDLSGVTVRTRGRQGSRSCWKS